MFSFNFNLLFFLFLTLIPIIIIIIRLYIFNVLNLLPYNLVSITTNLTGFVVIQIQRK